MDTGSDSPQGITSSADRMVGMEHSEVRYFTRYVIARRLSRFEVDANKFIATTTTVNYPDGEFYVWFWLTIFSFWAATGIHEEMLVSTNLPDNWLSTISNIGFPTF